MSFLVIMRPAREGTEARRAAGKLLVAADPGVTSGWLVPEIRSLWIVAGR